MNLVLVVSVVVAVVIVEVAVVIVTVVVAIVDEAIVIEVAVVIVAIVEVIVVAVVMIVELAIVCSSSSSNSNIKTLEKIRIRKNTQKEWKISLASYLSFDPSLNPYFFHVILFPKWYILT